MFDIKLGENRVPLWTKLLTSLLLALLSVSATAERIKDLASLQGVRNNQLVGYGLVVGLDGSGDQTTQTPFTTQSIINMLAQLGTTLPTTPCSRASARSASTSPAWRRSSPTAPPSST